MKKGIHNITIIGRRWFDKIRGSTYHSVDVWVNGELIGENPYEYGYGDQYVQSAFEILQAAGVYKKSTSRKIIHKKHPSGHSEYDTLEMYEKNQQEYSKFIQDQRNHRNKFIISVSDVGRKKDL